MKKAQNKNISDSSKKSSSKNKNEKEVTKPKSNLKRRDTLSGKSSITAKIPLVSKSSEAVGYSSVSKDKDSERSRRTDNNLILSVGKRSKTKSPEEIQQEDYKSKNKKIIVERRNALKSSDIEQIKSLSKKEKKEKVINTIESSKRLSRKTSNIALVSRGRSGAAETPNKAKNERGTNEKKSTPASRRINLLNEGDSRKIEESIDKIKPVVKQGKKLAFQKIIDIKQTKPSSKTKAREEVESEEDEVIDLEKSSARKPVIKKKLSEKEKIRDERSRDEKISKEKEKQVKVPDSSNKKSKISESKTSIKGTPKQEKSKPVVKEESSQQGKHVLKKSPFTPTTPRKKSSEEISISEEDSEKKSKASREKKILKKPIKQQLPSNIDTSQISDEISRIIKRIEEKRKKVGGSEKKRSVGRSSKSKNISSGKRDKNSTAEKFNGALQTNNNIKVEHVIDILELSKREQVDILKTDVLLAIIEIALNSSYYSLSSFNRSKSFWDDVLNYNELKKIFNPLKAETLKKYWININNAFGDPIQIADFVKKHKKLFDKYKIMVLPMISTAVDYAQTNINDIENYIKNIPREPQRTEVKLTETLDKETGKIKTEKKKTLTSYKRMRTDGPIVRRFIGKNNINNVDEIIEGKKNLREGEDDFPNLLNKLEEEEGYRRDFLLDLKEEEKRKVFSINDEDKFIFKTIEDVVRKLNKYFVNYSDAFILESLKGNSFNIYQTFKYLSDPKANSSLIFNEVDDEIIRNMRSSDYFTKLCDEKGKNTVYMRIDYLNV